MKVNPEPEEMNNCPRCHTDMTENFDDVEPGDLMCAEQHWDCPKCGATGYDVYKFLERVIA